MKVQRRPALPSGKFRKLDERTLVQSNLLHVAVGTFEAPDGQRFDATWCTTRGLSSWCRWTSAPMRSSSSGSTGRRWTGSFGGASREARGERRAPRGDGSPGASRGTGLEAGRLQLIGHFFNSPGFSDEESWRFLATDLHTVPDERHGIEEEHMTVERYPLSHVDELVRSGEITDAKTIIGLFWPRAVLSQEKTAGNDPS